MKLYILLFYHFAMVAGQQYQYVRMTDSTAGRQSKYKRFENTQVVGWLMDHLTPGCILSLSNDLGYNSLSQKRHGFWNLGFSPANFRFDEMAFDLRWLLVDQLYKFPKRIFLHTICSWGNPEFVLPDPRTSPNIVCLVCVSWSRIPLLNLRLFRVALG